jgi:hypothetical protein
MTTLLQKTVRLALAALLFVTVTAHAEEPWRQSFEETCSKTEQAMTLTEPELTALVQKCDELQKVIESQEESLRRVYLKRLQLCRNLYSYVLDYKRNAVTAK